MALTPLLVAGLLAGSDLPPSVAVFCATVDQPRPAEPGPSVPTAARTGSARLAGDAAALLVNRNHQTVTEAIAKLQQATQLDPGNSDAFARLANAHGLSPRYADVPHPAAEARQWQAATRAHALAPDDPLVLLALANAVIAVGRDLGCAERILLHARHKTPQNADVGFGLSSLRGSRGDFAAAYADLDAAIANAGAEQQLALRYNSGRLYLMAGDYQRVIDHYAALITANPLDSRNWLARFYRGLAFSALGNNEQALREVMLAPPGPDGDAGALANQARLQILGGARAEGLANLQRLLDRDRRGQHVIAYQVAAVYEALGDRDAAFRWLHRYLREVDGLGSWLLWLARDPRWTNMRKDPRFANLLAAAQPLPVPAKPSAPERPVLPSPSTR